MSSLVNRLSVQVCMHLSYLLSERVMLLPHKMLCMQHHAKYCINHILARHGQRQDAQRKGFLCLKPIGTQILLVPLKGQPDLTQYFWFSCFQFSLQKNCGDSILY